MPYFLSRWSMETGTFLGMGGEQSEAEVGLGGSVCKLFSFSSKFQVPGVPGREMTEVGISLMMSFNLVSFSGTGWASKRT